MLQVDRQALEGSSGKLEEEHRKLTAAQSTLTQQVRWQEV
jgi:hypothetical protein